MATVTVRESEARTNPREDGRAVLVASIGESRFGPTLARFLNQLCGADHFAAFRIGRDEVREVAACCIDPERTARDRVACYVNQGWWRRDPAMVEAQRCLQAVPPTVIRMDFSDDAYAEVRPAVYYDVRDRLLLCGHGANADFGLSILRSDPHAPFPADAVKQVADAANFLMAVLGKHADMDQGRPNVALALTSLEDIENCIVGSCALPRREAEVAARIVYGMSSAGIARDLSITDETVKTYRKRAYQRLTIGSERELLTWYLARWCAWRGQRFEVAPPMSRRLALSAN